MRHHLSRCPDHMAIKKAADKLRKGNSGWISTAPSPTLAQTCDDIIRLQESRISADYNIAMHYRKVDAKEATDRAQRVITNIQALQRSAATASEIDALLLESLKITCPAR